MNLILVRHTKTVVPEDICYGQSDVLPSQEFQTELKEIEKKLKPINPDMVYSSPLIRCKVLALELGFKSVKIDNRLMEYNFGDWELKLWNNITGEYADRWMNDFINTPAPKGESLIQMASRVESFLDCLTKTNFNTVLCFTHSGVIRVVNCLVNKKNLKEAFKLQVDFGGIYTFELKND